MKLMRRAAGAVLALLIFTIGPGAHAQVLTPTYNFALPTYAPGAVTLGLGSNGADLFLFTTKYFYTSPLDVGGSMAFTQGGDLGAAIPTSLQSQVLFNPTDATNIFVTAKAGPFSRLYGFGILPPSAVSVPIAGEGTLPTGLAALDGGELFFSSANAGEGIFRLPNAQTDTPDLYFGNSGPGALSTPTALTFGPDRLLYVLDTGDNRVVSFDTDGVYQNAFTLTNEAVPSALAIDDGGHLYTMNSQGGGDIYDIYSGSHLGTIADTNDTGFTGGKGSLFFTDGYLFSTSGTGQNVYVYAVPEPSTLALLVVALAGMAGYTLRRRSTGPV